MPSARRPRTARRASADSNSVTVSGRAVATLAAARRASAAGRVAAEMSMISTERQ